MRKKPTSLGLHEPLRHPDHSRPRTRREFVAQGFMTGAATVLGPSLLGLMAGPRAARAALAGDISTAVANCGITTGAGMIPFICFDLAGGGNIAGSNVLVGGPKGQLDFLSVAGYSKLGLPGTMVPNPSTSGNFIDGTFGLRFHSDSAHLRGMKMRTGASAMANTTGTVIPALSQNDTNVNPHNPMYGIYSAGARGGLLNLIGSESSISGGNSMAPPNWIIPSAAPVKISSSADSKGLVSTGQLGVLLPTPSDVTNVMESMKRISDAKYSQVQAYTNAASNSSALGPTGTQACGYTKAAYIVDKYNSPSAVNPDVDPNIVGSGGIFTSAEYAANSDYRKTAAVMKLVIDGNAAAGTIEMDGFDYHTGDRATGEARDFNVGNCIGAVLEYAARVKSPVMIYVFSRTSGLYLEGYGAADDARFARVFSETWRSLPLWFRRRCVRFWTTMRTHPDAIVPRIEVADVMSDWFRDDSDIAIAQCGMMGRLLTFCGPVVDAMPDDVLRILIAHELAHVHQWASGEREKLPDGMVEIAADELLYHDLDIDPEPLALWQAANPHVTDYLLQYA